MLQQSECFSIPGSCVYVGFAYVFLVYVEILNKYDLKCR
jgi:hypothetical protein